MRSITRFLIATLAVLIPGTAGAEMPPLAPIVERHVLSGYRSLAEQSRALSEVAEQDCHAESAALRGAYNGAFDAWIAVSHLRFGPSEEGNRAFALAFWPDPRSKTPKALGSLIRAADPIVETPEGFATVSIAARGFHALEFLLYDPQFMAAGGTGYGCALIRAVTGDIAANAAAILDGWEGGYAEALAVPGNDIYRSEEEAVKQLFTALLTGLQFSSEARLGRVLGTFERPRPNRAEARRSGRSLRHVVLSLEATRALAGLLSQGDAEIDGAFDTALGAARELDDPVFAGVSDPAARLRVEILQQRIDAIRRRLSEDLGPRLGIAAGFNALDGD